MLVYEYIYIHIYILCTFNGTGDFIYPVGKGGSRSELGVYVSIFPISHAESVGVTIRAYQTQYDSYWIQCDMAVYITQQYNI